LAHLASARRPRVGKSRTLSEWVNEQAVSRQASRIALVAATAADVRDVIVEEKVGSWRLRRRGAGRSTSRRDAG
jgi:phage terminase large subunit-like protein